jgi:hypothetical protein
MKPYVHLVALGAALCLSQAAHAGILFQEGFNYPIGNLGGNDGWTGSSANLAVGSANLAYPGLTDLGGNSLTVNGGAASTTVNTFAAVTSGSVYYSFLARCEALPTANRYLTSLLQTGEVPNGGTDALAVYVGQQVAGSQFRIGVRHEGVGTGATYVTDPLFTVGSVNLFVVKYTFGSGGSVSLFVNPTPAGSEPVANVLVGPGGTEALNIDRFGFKANSATDAGSWTFDTLRVGDTWESVTIPEPSVFALAGLSLALAAWRRVRR